MATNKNALIRYRTIDQCLQNRQRRWTLEDLIQACSDALIEYEGKDANVSKRTVQLDIQNMRSSKLGYNAPIVCYNRKYYTYEDESYSITKSPVSKIDLEVLTESMMVLSQFKEFSLFQELGGMIQKLEDKIYRESKDQASIIIMDKNQDLRGLEHLDTLYQAILKQIVLDIHYKSFTARRESVLVIHPYILREYNNRWFLVGRQEKKDTLLTLALDRIEAIEVNLSVDYKMIDFQSEDYYKNTIGVTVLSDDQIIEVQFKVDSKNAPYVATKPFHSTQKLIEKHQDHSMTFQINVHHNFELERLLLGFGEGITVISPKRLIDRIKRKLKLALRNYE